MFPFVTVMNISGTDSNHPEPGDNPLLSSPRGILGACKHRQLLVRHHWYMSKPQHPVHESNTGPSDHE